nr:MAG TPA: hypothetical protein [Caudoviricetes sp.]
MHFQSRTFTYHVLYSFIHILRYYTFDSLLTFFYIIM